MSDRPSRCPFCANTDLSPLDAIRWSCIGSLGCGGVWDPAVLVAPAPRPERVEETELPHARREVRLRGRRRLLRPGW